MLFCLLVTDEAPSPLLRFGLIVDKGRRGREHPGLASAKAEAESRENLTQSIPIPLVRTSSDLIVKLINARSDRPYSHWSSALPVASGVPIIIRHKMLGIEVLRATVYDGEIILPGSDLFYENEIYSIEVLETIRTQRAIKEIAIHPAVREVDEEGSILSVRPVSRAIIEVERPARRITCTLLSERQTGDRERELKEAKEAVEKKLRHALSVCRQLKYDYYVYYNLSKTQCESNPWMADRGNMFKRHDMFITRCEDLLHLCKTAQQFEKMSTVVIGGNSGAVLTNDIEGVASQFNKIFDQMKTCGYDCLDVSEESCLSWLRLSPAASWAERPRGRDTMSGMEGTWRVAPGTVNGKGGKGGEARGF